MLLRFSVQNYLSFKDVQTLDLVANVRHKECLGMNAFSTQNPLCPEVLKTAAILGANASGKSNLLKALQVLRALVIRKEVVGPNPVALVKPFRFVSGKTANPFVSVLNCSWKEYRTNTPLHSATVSLSGKLSVFTAAKANVGVPFFAHARPG